MKTSQSAMVIVGLVVLLVGVFVYIGVDNYKDSRLEVEQAVFQEGAAYGYEQAVYSLVEQAVTCEAVSVMVENYTLDLIAVECLQVEDGS